MFCLFKSLVVNITEKDPECSAHEHDLQLNLPLRGTQKRTMKTRRACLALAAERGGWVSVPEEEVG